MAVLALGINATAAGGFTGDGAVGHRHRAALVQEVPPPPEALFPVKVLAITVNVPVFQTPP